MDEQAREQLEQILWEMRWACDDLAEECALARDAAGRRAHLRSSPRHLSPWNDDRARPVDALLCTYEAMAQEDVWRLTELHHEWAAWFAWTAGRALLAAGGIAELAPEDVEECAPGSPDRDRRWDRWAEEGLPPLPTSDDLRSCEIGSAGYLEDARRRLYKRGVALRQERTEALVRYGAKASEMFAQSGREARMLRTTTSTFLDQRCGDHRSDESGEVADLGVAHSRFS